MAISDILSQAIADATQALAEDMGDEDLSARLIPSKHRRQAILYSRENAVLCGQAWFESCFLLLDKNARFHWQLDEGADMAANTTIATVQAEAKALISAERSALNFLQTLSATATIARKLQSQVPQTKLVDTRKTLPLLRYAQKYAVRVGGAHNHRHGLFDEILIKENHITAGGGIPLALQQARSIIDEAYIQIEVGNLQELSQAVQAGAKRVLLDNFSLSDIQQAVDVFSRQVELEASGNVNESSLVDIAATGIARISVGALTKNIKAIDFSFIIT